MIRELVSNRELENFTNQFGNKRTNLKLSINLKLYNANSNRRLYYAAG